MKFQEVRSELTKGVKDGFVRYGKLAQEIVDMEPESAVGYRLLGWYNYYTAKDYRNPIESRRAAMTEASKMAEKALSLDDSDASAYVLLGNIYLLKKQYEEAIQAGEHAVELEPNGAMTHGLFGRILTYAGRADQAIYHLEKAIRLDPFPDYYMYLDLGRSYIIKGDYEKALTAIKKGDNLAPNNVMSYILLGVDN